jgi:hypothetical protein
MNKKLLIVMVFTIIASSATGVYAYSSIVNVTDANVQVDNSSVVIDNSNVTFGGNVTILNPESTVSADVDVEPEHAEASIAPVSTPAPNPFRVAVYEWTLRSEYVNNTGWLSGLRMNSYFYSKEASFARNYRMYLDQFYISFADGTPANVVVTDLVYDEVSGYTRLTTNYRSDGVMQIESVLPSISDGRGWTVKFI